MGAALYGIGAIGGLVCWIIVLIKMFQQAGVVHGIIGIICGLWAFIWGWMNATPANIRNVMIAWTVFVILSFVGAGMSGFALSGSPVGP